MSAYHSITSSAHNVISINKNILYLTTTIINIDKNCSMQLACCSKLIKKVDLNYNTAVLEKEN